MFNLDIPILTKLFDFYKGITQSISSFPKTKQQETNPRSKNQVINEL